MEESLRQGRHGHQSDRGRSRVLAEYRHLVRVAAELADVCLDPVEDHHLVPQSLVAGGGLVVCGEEAEGAEPVVEGDEDDVLLQQVAGTEEETGAAWTR